jgi:hypothetical protein
MKELFATVTLKQRGKVVSSPRDSHGSTGANAAHFEGAVSSSRLSSDQSRTNRKKEKLSRERNPFPRNLKSVDGLS